jgi:outer membrane protein insertion porin family
MIHSKLRCFFLLLLFGSKPIFAQQIQSLEWLSSTPEPKGLRELIGKDIGSKEFSNSIKVLKATDEYQDLEYRFDSGKLIMSAKEKAFVRDIVWHYPEALPSYVRNDLELHLDISEDDVLPDDVRERIERLAIRLKARGYQDFTIKETLQDKGKDKNLIIDFPPSGRPREEYTAIDFKNVEDPNLYQYLAKRITDLDSLGDPKWKQDGTRYKASKPFVKDDIELEEFRVNLRKRMRSRGYLNFELEISADSSGALVVTSRNLRQFEFQFEGQVFYYENELRNLLMENLSDRNFDVEEAKFLVADAYVKKGYRDIAVDTRIESTGNKYKVFFKIKEGPQYFFRAVDFRNVRPEQLPLLRDAEKDWIEPFRSPFRYTYFDEAGLKSSLGILIEGIRSRGFLDVEVTDYDFSLRPDSRYAQLKISLRVGPRYKFSSFEIKDDEGILPEVAEMKIPKVGEFYDGAKLQTFLRELKRAYEEQGYLYSEVETNPQKTLEKNPLLNTVAATIHIHRGPKVFLRNLQIIGNTRTKKKVIIREMGDDALEFGEKITPKKSREFENRLLNTGLFSTVDLKPVGTNVEFRGAQTFTDYELAVKERPGGGVEFGPGFRTDLGVVGFGEFSYRNLGGWNRGVFAKVQVSHKLKRYQFLEQDYSASFVEPYPFDFRSRLRFDVRYILDDDIQYNGDTPIKGYNLEETSTSAKLEKRFTEHLSAVATLYQYSLPRLFNIHSETTDTTRKYRLGGNGLEVLLDYRDNIFNTLEGWLLSEKIEYFSPYLASNQKVNFITSSTRGNVYIHLGKEAVIAISLGYDHLLGLSDDAIIPEHKRLKLGGRSSLRSLPENFLRFDGVGVAEERAMLGRFEYRMPLFSGWGVAAFYEAGEIDVINDKVSGERSTGLRHGAGFGVRYKTPVGPLAVDWAYNFQARPNEDKYQISLTIGAF